MSITLRAAGGITFGITGPGITTHLTVDLSRYDVCAVQALAAWLCCPVGDLPQVIRSTTECMTVAEMAQWDWAEFLYAPNGHGDCVNGLCKLRPHSVAKTLFAGVLAILYSQEVHVLDSNRLTRIGLLCQQWMTMCNAFEVFGCRNESV